MFPWAPFAFSRSTCGCIHHQQALEEEAADRPTVSIWSPGDAMDHIHRTTWLLSVLSGGKHGEPGDRPSEKEGSDGDAGPSCPGLQL